MTLKAKSLYYETLSNLLETIENEIEKIDFKIDENIFNIEEKNITRKFFNERNDEYFAIRLALTDVYHLIEKMK